MEKREYAVALKHDGRNCCQAVLEACAEELDLPAETLNRLGAAFGLGMDTMQATCGALCGAQMALGLMEAGRKPVRGQARQVLEAFREKAGATQCRKLKGVDTGAVLCACDDCVRYAVDALEAVRSPKP